MSKLHLEIFPVPQKKLSGIPVAHLADIGLMKLLAITHRATLRDYIDLAALFQERIVLKELLTAGKRKYGGNFNPMIYLRALVSFEDLDQEMPVMIDKNLESSWQSILREAVKRTAGI